jgi:PAS domain S-box-containing protein
VARKALVVDNDFFFVEFLSELLEQRGYETVKAYDGKEGIAKLEQGPVDILFADIIMPKIDGTQLIQFARVKFPDRRFPIIALSGTIIEQIEKIREFGADYFIAKGPLQTMGEQINALLDRMEDRPGALSRDEEIIEPGSLFPRQETVELIEVLGFQKAILQCIGVGILVMDRDARILMANQAALGILGESVENLLNRQVATLLAERDRPKLVAGLKRLLQEKDPGRVSLWVSLGSENVLAVVSLLRAEEKIAGFIIALEDKQAWGEQA